MPTILLYEKNAENFFTFSHFFFFLSFEFNLLDIRNFFSLFMQLSQLPEKYWKYRTVSKLHIDISTPLTITVNFYRPDKIYGMIFEWMYIFRPQLHFWSYEFVQRGCET